MPTPEEFRAVGFTEKAAEYPRSEIELLLFAAFNNVKVEQLTPGMRYHANLWMESAWQRVADAAKVYFEWVDPQVYLQRRALLGRWKTRPSLDLGDEMAKVLDDTIPMVPPKDDSELTLFRERTPQDGVIRLQHWPEGYVLWYHGKAVWKSWENAGGQKPE